MISETYVECLVKKKAGTAMILLKTVSIMLAVVFLLAGLVLWPALIIGALVGVAAYFIYLNSDLEYEYLYLDKEITVDKVMAKTRRKRVAKYDVQRLEIFAPMNSYHLGDYKNRTVKTYDYSSGEVKQPEQRYVMYYEGGQKIILEPSAEMVKALKNVAPRKIFTD
ncbi:DUF6106 family protein [Kineothrix sp. MB12-C1]|uniref:DUF6106 family protein n=1 Tax=Kineothrix sp. MB12-C1 TaxID=3070215 RepID=UPI0027D31498|nr:DUF6106 family protein [Kineothrix sp. MB12-C1]WMC91839.1 DUF6106 family protein [Kineothrix sp. MB12-C1]